MKRLTKAFILQQYSICKTTCQHNDTFGHYSLNCLVNVSKPLIVLRQNRSNQSLRALLSRLWSLFCGMAGLCYLLTQMNFRDTSGSLYSNVQQILSVD